MTDGVDSFVMLPPVLVAGGLILGYPLADWVKIMTILYILVGIICSIKRAFFPAQPVTKSNDEVKHE